MSLYKTLRNRSYAALFEGIQQKWPLRGVSAFLHVLIIANILGVFLEPSLRGYPSLTHYLHLFDKTSLSIFLVEYLFRLWCCVEGDPERGPVWGRIRYIFTPMAICDLLVLVPFIYSISGLDLRLLRIFRLIRLLRLIKLYRYSRALRTLKDILVMKRGFFIITISLFALLITVSSYLLIYFEYGPPYEHFATIPSIIFWLLGKMAELPSEMQPRTAPGQLIVIFTVIISRIFLVAIPSALFVSGLLSKEREWDASGQNNLPPS